MGHLEKIPKEWLECSKIIENIGDELRREIKDMKPRTLDQYRYWLDRLTGSYMTLTPIFKKYRAKKENNEVAKYVAIRTHWPKGEKFVSAAADKEASSFVAKERYIRDWLEGWILAAEQGIRTIKRHLNLYEKEKGISATVE